MKSWIAYLLGVLTPFLLLGVVAVFRAVIELWVTLRLYGGEKERNLNFFGRILQRSFQRILKALFDDEVSKHENW